MKVDPNNPSVPFVADSAKIAAYLDAQYPQLPLLFGTNPASTQFIVNYVNTQIQPLIAKLCFDDARNHLDPDGLEWYYSGDRATMFGYKKGMPRLQVDRKDFDKVIKEFRKALEPFRATVKEHKFVGGDQPNCGFFGASGRGKI